MNHWTQVSRLAKIAFRWEQCNFLRVSVPDEVQMSRMGKQQVFVRHFRPMATFSFNAMATCVWEFGIFSVHQGLVDGGRAGLFWSTVVHAICFIPVILSMAEMESIAPTA